MPTRERMIIESMLQIADKDGYDVPFILNESQAKLDDNLTGRDIVPKARQEGVSSYVLALFTIRCMYKRNTRAVVISHDNESTERLFKRVQYYLDHIRGPKAQTGFSSKREFTFPKTGSMFYIGTAGARKFGRGDTITDLHCSEVAFWDNPKELFSGLSDAVPYTGTIILESTGNGRNWYYRRVRNATQGKGRYKIHFLNWQDFKEYDLKVSDEEAEEIIKTLDPALEEDYLYHTIGLTPGQIKFRRYKLEEKDFDLDLFKQEYPLTLDECFRATGTSIFHKINYDQTKGLWVRVDQELHILTDHPKRDGIYGVGVDVGGGVGKDRSVIEVFDLRTLHQVAEWVSDRIPPDRLAHEIVTVAKLFNDAYVTEESNNHGIVTLDRLRGLYPNYLLYKKSVSAQSTTGNHLLNYGLLQTSRMKPLSIGALRRLLATNMTIYSPDFMDEAGSFVEKDSGRLEAEDGSYDDRIMAAAVFAQTYERASMMKRPPDVGEIEVYDPFDVETMINELRGRRRKGFPIANQAGGYGAGSTYLQ